MAGRNSKQKITSTALSAVAFQDHLVKSLNLSNTGKKVVNYPLPVKKKKNSGFVSKSEAKETEINRYVGGGVEYVIKQNEVSKRKKQSLAEKLGILEAQTKGPILSEREWSILKRKSYLRNDLSTPCAICKEQYTLYREQVLLSCSHTFHRKCLSSFEKFSSKNSCPICRRDNYEKRVIFEGAHITMNRSAINIQAQWKGYILRKKYLEMTKDIVPKNEKLRKKFFESKFINMSNKLVETYDNHNVNVTEFLETIDHNIAASKSIMDRLEDIHLENKWENIQMKAIIREIEECPICLVALNSEKNNGTVLLSCSHVYHEKCLLSYEQYCEQTQTLCPVCRTSYKKRNYYI